MPDEPTTPLSPSDPPPTGVENYQLGREIATGGMGSVLEAEDAKLQRTVAIKVMLLEGNADEVIRQRFIREARVLARLAHPNIVPIHDIVWEDGLPLFYSMKLVKGHTLSAILKDLRAEDADVLREYPMVHLLDIFRKVCDAIAFAHSMGVLHRDLKPDNVMVGEFGEVLVMDWGLAKSADLADTEYGPGEIAPAISLWPGLHSDYPQADDLSSATLQGTVLGTPQYMSPEQASGQIDGLDERSDIYALGGILYAILTLRPPVEGATPQEVLSKVLSGSITMPSDLRTTFRGKRQPFSKGDVLDAALIKPLPHLRGGRVPVALSCVAMKALQLEKDQRYQHVTDMSADIDAYQGGHATDAEEAGAWKQLWLLMFRHRAVTVSLAVLLLISLGFVWKLVKSQNAMGRALAVAQHSVADQQFRSGLTGAMVEAVESIPERYRDHNWNYLSSRQDSSLGPLLISGFSDDVQDIVPLSHEPGQFAIANGDGRVGIVDVVSKALVRVIDTGSPGLVRIAASGDGKRLLTRTDDDTKARIYDTGTVEKITTLALPFPGKPIRKDRTTCVQLDATGGLAAIGYEAEKKLHVLETATGRLLWSYDCQPRYFRFSLDGTRLIVARSDRLLLEILDLTDGTLLHSFAADVVSMDLTLDGGYAVAVLQSGDWGFFDLKQGTRVARRLHNGTIGQIAFTAGGNVLALHGGNRESVIPRAVALIDYRRQVSLGVLHGFHSHPAYLPLRPHPTSGHLLTLQSPPQLWQFTDQPLARIVPGGDLGWSCDFVSDSILLARKGRSVACRDVSDPSDIEELETPFFPGHQITAAHPGSGLFASAFGPEAYRNDGDSLLLNQLTRDGINKQWSLPALDMDGIARDLVFDAEGKRLLRIFTTNKATVIDTRDGTTLATLEPKVGRAEFAGSKGQIIALLPVSSAGALSGRIASIDPETGKVTHSVEVAHCGGALAVSPDRRLIAVSGNDGSVILLDADTLQVKQRFGVCDSNAIFDLAFHPSRPVLAVAAASDLNVKLWHYPTESLQQTFLGFNGNPVSISFSPSGHRLAVEGEERSVRIFAVDPMPE